MHPLFYDWYNYNLLVSYNEYESLYEYNGVINYNNYIKTI